MKPHEQRAKAYASNSLSALDCERAYLVGRCEDDVKELVRACVSAIGTLDCPQYVPERIVFIRNAIAKFGDIT